MNLSKGLILTASAAFTLVGCNGFENVKDGSVNTKILGKWVSSNCLTVDTEDKKTSTRDAVEFKKDGSATSVVLEYSDENCEVPAQVTAAQGISDIKYDLKRTKNSKKSADMKVSINFDMNVDPTSSEKSIVRSEIQFQIEVSRTKLVMLQVGELKMIDEKGQVVDSGSDAQNADGQAVKSEPVEAQVYYRPSHFAKKVKANKKLQAPEAGAAADAQQVEQPEDGAAGEAQVEAEITN